MGTARSDASSTRNECDPIDLQSVDADIVIGHDCGLRLQVLNRDRPRLQSPIAVVLKLARVYRYTHVCLSTARY